MIPAREESKEMTNVCKRLARSDCSTRKDEDSAGGKSCAPESELFVAGTEGFTPGIQEVSFVNSESTYSRGEQFRS